MMAVEEARQLVLSSAPCLQAQPSALPNSLGLFLAQDITSDVDMPPYDKALVDGFAVRSSDLQQGTGALEVVGEIFAGQSPAERSVQVAQGQAVRIMTGAPIPPGADAVVMVERTAEESSGLRLQGSEGGGQTAEGGEQGEEIRDKRSEISSTVQQFNSSTVQQSHSPLTPDPSRLTTGQSPLTTHQTVTINDPSLRPGQNIMRRGTELTRGQVVLRAGTRIRPPEIGLLAEVGLGQVLVYPRPRMAIVSTGDELVEPDHVPGPSQIRNSNGPTLVALVVHAGGEPQYLGIARDTREDLLRLIRRGLEADLLLLSGGVSAGQLDLVPSVLNELGVREVFHKVNLKPGKPIWFGVLERGASSAESEPSSVAYVSPQRSPLPAPGSTLVFGLPGNPVSVLVCFELFVRPAIHKMMGTRDPIAQLVWAQITEDKQYCSDRPTYWPAWFEPQEDGMRARPLPWHGSPDLRAMTDANALVLFPPGDHRYCAGDRVQVLVLGS